MTTESDALAAKIQAEIIAYGEEMRKGFESLSTGLHEISRMVNEARRELQRSPDVSPTAEVRAEAPSPKLSGRAAARYGLHKR